jgi:phosphatidylinositol alpha-1,6-mannosyltransferase
VLDGEGRARRQRLGGGPDRRSRSARQAVEPRAHARYIAPVPSRTLFITRTFPPAVGGMQAYSFHLFERFRRHHATDLVALSRSPKHLVWFVPYAIARGLATVLTRPVTHIYVGDAVMAPVGLLLGLVRREAQTVVTVHGLDLTYANPLYQAMVKLCVPRFDRVVSNSRATARVAEAKGVSPDRIRVVPCGILPAETRTPREEARAAVAERLGLSLDGRKVVVTAGRLVRRKGVAWFIENVLPRLDGAALYLVIGDGPDAPSVRAAASVHSPERVRLLGRTDDRTRDLVLDAADVFVMPNILVPGDMEGFGIVALEAGVRGLPVVASRIEGIVDAVEDGVTGVLVDPHGPEAFVRGIEQALALDREAIPSAVLARCHWDAVFDEYVQHLGLEGRTESVSAGG